MTGGGSCTLLHASALGSAQSCPTASPPYPRLGTADPVEMMYGAATVDHSTAVFVLYTTTQVLTVREAHLGPLIDPPQDPMCCSIFVTLCCCWLIGIFAIVSSAECEYAIAADNREMADKKSTCSRANLAVVVSFILLMICNIEWWIQTFIRKYTQQ